MRVFLGTTWLVASALAFAPRPHGGAPPRSLARRRGMDFSGPNEFDAESPEQRAARMEKVRFLQRVFYADERGAAMQRGGADGGVAGVFEDLPMWRVQWAELPGAQNVLNVWQARVRLFTHTSTWRRPLRAWRARRPPRDPARRSVLSRPRADAMHGFIARTSGHANCGRHGVV